MPALPLANPPLLIVVGMNYSPYTRKLRAVLRYRRIPHRFVVQASPEAKQLPKAPGPDLIPQLIMVNDKGELEASLDSTYLIRTLETRIPNGRPVLPRDPVLRFVSDLLEDFADEWLTKAMFHYRWHYPADAKKAASILLRGPLTSAPEETARSMGDYFGSRQVGRLGLVRGEPVSVVEDSFLSTLKLLDAHLATSRFLLGDTPCACDFAFQGQLWQLVCFDETSMRIAVASTPRIVAWVELLDDISGVEPEPLSRAHVLSSPTLKAFLQSEIGEVYLKFLQANELALEQKAKEVKVSIRGVPYKQGPFPYQRKCLAELRSAFQALAPNDQVELERQLLGTVSAEVLSKPQRARI